MTETIKRTVISVVICLVVYIGSGIITGVQVNDALVETLEFMSGVIAAGCYWIGSKPIN